MYAQILMVYTSLVFNVAVPTSMSARSFFICMIFSYFESDFRMYLKKKNAPPTGKLRNSNY